MTNIIAIVRPEHLFKYGPGFGIPTDFWVANKEAFPKGTLPTMLYQDHGELTPITISDNPRMVAGSEYNETGMLFKLAWRTVLRLKDELLRVWGGGNHEMVLSGTGKFLFCWQMDGEQRRILTRLNIRLLEVEKSLHERIAQLSKEYPEHCLSGRIHFILNENDSEWTDEDDNILARLDYDHDTDYDPSANWNDCPHLIKNEKGEPEHLCWLYHELYDHTGLAWEDLLRIGQIKATIKVNFDYNF